MTCEVAVMNRRGVALAADSAVTLGNGKKIYHTAEKLFAISSELPVAIMTYGSAEIMDAPWETVIKMYAAKLGDKRFDTLEDYATNFLGFIEGSSALFSPAKQAEYVSKLVWSVWSTYRPELEERLKAMPASASASEREAALADVIRADQKLFERYDDHARLGSSYAAQVLRMYAEDIDRVEADFFEGTKLSARIKRALRGIVRLMFSKEWLYPAERSGVVLAGMGEEEAYPVVEHYHVGTIAAGKLRYMKQGSARIGIDSDAFVVPFAQREIIDTIIDGIHPSLQSSLSECLEELPRPDKPKKTADDEDDIDRVKQQFEQQVRERYEGPFMEAVSALPRQDLAKMAEALVSLTAFVVRMTADQEESVAEPIDVAILSKGDGFTWVKHKDLIREAGRLAL